MNKCDVTPKTLRQIQSLTAQLLMKSAKEPVEVMKQKMVDLLNDIADKYSLTGVTEISRAIYDIAQRFGVVDRSSLFFSEKNIKQLLTGANLGILRTNTLETSTDKLTDTEQVRTRLEANKEFLDNAYGLAKNVRLYVENLTNQHIFDCCFIDRGSVSRTPRMVRSNSELNENIRNYQEFLLKRIADYFNYMIATSPNMDIDAEIKELLQNPKLYEIVDGTRQNTGILTKLKGLVSSYLSSELFTPDILRELYKTATDPTKSLDERAKALRRLDAYNANVILTHFDTYLSVILGKAIQIQNFNEKTGKDKYQISGKTAKLATTWRVSENIDVESEADAITKLAINTTPLIRWGDSTLTLVNGQFLHFSDFEHIIAKIKDLSYREDVMTTIFDDNFIEEQESIWLSLSPETRAFLKDKSLSTAINMIRRNPRLYLSAIFELLTNTEFYDLTLGTFFSNKVFTADELDKLYSMSMGIFNPQIESSLYSIAGIDFDTDYYSFITQTADSIFKVNYVLYFRDLDGVIQVRTLIDLSVNNISRAVELTINTGNSVKLIKNFEDYKTELSLRPNSDEEFKYIEFELPLSSLSIKVKVTAASGDVVFTDLTTGTPVRRFDLLWGNEEVILYLDTILRLNLSEDIDLQNALRKELRSLNDMCKSLLSFAARVHLNQYVSAELLQGLTPTVRDAKINKIYGKNPPKYNYQLDELGLIHGNDIPTLKAIALAKANVTGVTTAALVKDGEGNGLSLQTLSRLLGSLQSQFDLLERLPGSVTNESLIVTVPGLYEGVYTAKEFYDPATNSKAFTDMAVSEMSFAGIVQDFIGGLMPREDNSLVGNGHVLFLPSVNSDKNTIGRLKINLNKEVTVNGVTKPIWDLRTLKFNLSSAELETVIAQEFGKIYTKMYTAVTLDWQTLYNYFHSMFPGMPNLSADYLYGFEHFNAWWNTEGRYIDSIPRNGLLISNSSPAEFIKSLTLEYNRTHRLLPLEFIDLVHFKNNKGKLGINQAFISQIARFNPEFLRAIDPTFNVDAYPSQRLFWDTKKAELLKGLLKSKFRVNTTATKSPELEYLKAKYPDWINVSGDMVLAKVVINGKTVSITSNRDIALLQEQFLLDNINNVVNVLSTQYSLQLNPILELYNYLDYLFTLEFMCATVGSFIAHPEKSKSSDVLQQEAAHFLALHKRNVSFTAAMHAFQLNLLNGIPEVYNIAVIDDITDEQGSILGLKNGIKPFDGATFVNPFVVILENNSLGGARAGITKKQFVHFKNERTGTGGIIKTAGFGLTNDWIRNSPFLERMMRKMTNHKWYALDKQTQVSLDFTTDYKGNKIAFNDIFFLKNNRYYQMGNIQVYTLRNPVTGETYHRFLPTIHELAYDENGNCDGRTVERTLSLEETVDLFSDTLEFNEVGFVVETNYQLWNFFGGKNSMAFKNGERYLSYSNTSVENVVKAINNVGTIIGDSTTRVETLDLLWLPLKHSDVHYVPTAGAVKQGAANINSAAKYSNDEDYDIQRIKMYLAGIQLDKEHHADDSELSLMTLVISACAAKGYTLDAAMGLYDALRKATENGTKDHLQAVRELFKTGSDNSVALLEVMMKAIITALDTSNSDNFAKIVALDLIRRAREGNEIKFADAMLPLSDNTVYAKVFSIIASYLTNSGIKLKIPGILSVLTPSHNIFLLYAGQKYESYADPRTELARKLAWQKPVYKVGPTIKYGGLDIDLTEAPIIFGHPGIGKSYGLENGFAGQFIDWDVEYNHLRDRWIEEKTGTVKGTPEYHQARNEYLIYPENHPDYIEFLTENWNRVKAKAKAEGKALLVSPSILLKLFPLDFDYIINLTAEDFINRNVNRGGSAENSASWKQGVDAVLNSLPVDIPTITLLPGEYLSSIISSSSGNISDLELGRQYRITRILPSVVGTDGKPLYDPIEPNIETKLELIRTPAEYLKLKADINLGLVLNVTEAFIDDNGNPIGRDLAAYNVRFSTLDGSRFQLWDLDSAAALFEYNEVLETYEKEFDKATTVSELEAAVVKKAMALTAIFLKIFPNSPINLDNLETFLRRKLQRDLMNLSKSTPDLEAQYQKLLESRQNTPEWYTRFAHWVNILLGTGLGSVVEVNGLRTAVTAENFDVLEPEIWKLLLETTQVMIGGNLVTVDKSSVISLPYELIMPKTFATNFGFTEFTDLETVKNNRNYFIEQYLLNLETKVDENLYAVELKVSSGEHYYLLPKLSAIRSGLTKVENISTIVLEGKTYRTDIDGNTLYEITDDTEIYTDGFEHEVIVTDDLNFYVETLHFDSIKLSNNLRLLEPLLTSLIENFKKSNKKKVKSFARYVTDQGDSPESILALNGAYHAINIDNYTEFITTDPVTGEKTSTHSIILSGWEKHTSFLKSLDIVAARIPAQSMQSFMPMKVVAYDNPDINTAHVSTMLILLQGSDF